MKLPTRLDELLRQNGGLNATTLRAISVVEPWARDNKTIFFPEYTDHSLVHLQEVLAAADSLISDESWSHLTPEDAAVVTIAVLLHDCALHLTEEGFYTLIEGRYPTASSRYINGEQTWPQMWNEYLSKARRFDQRKLQSLFGDTDPVTAIPKKKIDLTLKHRLLIGEFLRLHHARLAHEIALVGIPGAAAPFVLTDHAHPELLDLAGYVARSHNLNIRSAIDALEASKRRVHLNCRVPFVMVVLRIADYIQIHSARAPGQLLRLKNLSSPVSRGEWRLHSYVKEINQAHEDPEALFVDCEPDSANGFLRARNLLRDIQSELDQCWAALGEVYGRFAPLNSLGMNIRRIRSNLDDPEGYRLARRPKYLPRDFRFRTSSAELMDLLVTPLYGAKPEIGVRELVQNAVDACLERDDLLAKGFSKGAETSNDDVIVTLKVQPGETPQIVVEDFGVGMTPDIIDQYFLNIGASFRSSDLWRKNHEVDGHATIHRTGRFGIGLLAAFLLGKEVRVTTRHLLQTDADAVTFLCTQGSDSIEVCPTSFHAGTKIEIALNPAAAKSLASETRKLDWFCLNRPRVRRVLIREGERTLPPQRLSVPECDSDLDSTHWRRVNVEGYDDVMWSYEAMRTNSYPWRALVCNGIFVTTSLYNLRPQISPGLNVLRASPPSLVVFDPDGRFPINLQRDQLAGRSAPLDKALAEDISRFCSEGIVKSYAAIESGLTDDSVAFAVNPGVPGLLEEDGQPRSAALLITRAGVVPMDLELLSEVKPARVIVDAVSIAAGRGSFKCPQISSAGIPYLAVDGVTQTKSSRTDFLRDCLGVPDYAGNPTGFFSKARIIGRRLFVRNEDGKELVSPGKVPKTQWSRLHREFTGKDYTSWTIGSVSSEAFDLGAIDQWLSASGSLGFTILYFDWSTAREGGEAPKTPFASAWRALVGAAELTHR